jgi:hypothetical protein
MYQHSRGWWWMTLFFCRSGDVTKENAGNGQENFFDIAERVK